MSNTNISKRAALISAVVTLLVCIAALIPPVKAAAEGTAQFYIPDAAVPAASQFTVSVEFTADSNIGTVQAQISYDENAIEFIGSDFGNGGGGLVTLNAFPDSPSNTLMVSMTFRALNPGSTRLDLISGSVMSPDGAMLSNSMTAYASVTISQDAQEDSAAADFSMQDENNDSEAVQTPSQPDGTNDKSAQLKSLTVSEGQLLPPFSPDVYDYTMTLPHDVDYLYIDAETADPLAGIWFEGSEYLADGITPRTITVTSPDGSVVNVYRISVTRLGEAEAEESNGSDGEFVIPSNEAYSDGSSDGSKAPETPRLSSSKDERSGVEQMRDRLMPALVVAMIVIVLAIIIMVFWIRSKSGKRSK